MNRDDIIVLRDRVTKKKLSDIDKAGTSIFCPFCDDLDSTSASAQVNIDKHGNYNIYCHHCKGTYWEQELQWNTKVNPNLYFDAKVGYVGMYDDFNGQLKYFKNIQDWTSYCKINDLHKDIYLNLPRCLPVVDMKEPFGVNEDKGTFNFFKPSEFLEDYHTVKKRIANDLQKELDLSGLSTHIPYIWRVLKNVFQSERDIKLFINWLGYIIQYREQSSLAWVIITAQGTGKGLITEKVLRPIFGYRAVSIADGNTIGAQFNAEDAVCWLKAYNEVFTHADFTTNLKRREWLKNRIGTNEITIEPKGVDKITVKNNVNYMLLGNGDIAILLEVGDRRFNVVNTRKQSVPLIKEPWWPGKRPFEDAIEAEVPTFAHFIQNIKVDEDKAMYPTDTPARLALIEASLEDTDYTVQKLKEGDADYFDLGTIFPSPAQLMGIDSNSAIRHEITECITKYRAIPSAYAIQIFSYHLKIASKTNIKRKLEQKGIKIGYQLWIKETKSNLRVYIHTDTISKSKNEEDGLDDGEESLQLA